MPNWCANRLEITLNKAADKVTLIRWINAEDGLPAWQTAIAQSLHLLLAGCAGILKPVKPIDFLPLPALTSHGKTGLVSPGNTAFTHWVELLMTAPDLDAACCQQIDQWYQAGLCEETLYRPWYTLTDSQKAVLSSLLSRCGFDWLNRTVANGDSAMALAWDDIQQWRHRRVAMPMDMRDLVPTYLAAELNGFNGRLWQTPEETSLPSAQAQWQAFAPAVSGYWLYLDRYGVKWPNGIEVRCSDDNDETHLSVDFDSPWSPPSEAVLCAISAHFHCTARHTYLEEGCGFCGYGEYANGLLIDGDLDEITYSEVENENGVYDITGPDYILEH